MNTSVILRIFPDNGSKYRPTDEVKITGKSRKQIGDLLIAIGVLLKEELPDRDEKGRFIKKEES